MQKLSHICPSSHHCSKPQKTWQGLLQTKTFRSEEIVMSCTTSMQSSLKEHRSSDEDSVQGYCHKGTGCQPLQDFCRWQLTGFHNYSIFKALLLWFWLRVQWPGMKKWFRVVLEGIWNVIIVSWRNSLWGVVYGNEHMTFNKLNVWHRIVNEKLNL